MNIDVGIGGCGVAGLALGALLARGGARVTIFDKLEAPAPLGSGLIVQPVGMAVLKTLGLDARVAALGARVDRLLGRARPSGDVVLDVRYGALPGDAHGVAVHRGALFDMLLDGAVAAGVRLEARCDVRGVENGRFQFAGGARSAPFDLLVDALGVRSPLSPTEGKGLAYGALWASLDWPPGEIFHPHALEQRYERARRMVGVMPIGRLNVGASPQAAFFWSLRHDAFAAWRAASIDAWKADVLALWPETAPFLDQVAGHDDLVFARYAHRTLASPVSRDLVHVGDSYHCTSPQLGQGANMALLDAFALSAALSAHAERADALAAYARMRRWHVRLYQA
ncbi:MAG: NAD(P)/FAD-dependent oxidoreductase, partial [Hyphomonadaceae bacterium]|nr:NAD(P)/FAD-dependent oxidoreductase [Hyphomonadaceae bacterium]